jgi:hypothetical protein
MNGIIELPKSTPAYSREIPPTAPVSGIVRIQLADDDRRVLSLVRLNAIEERLELLERDVAAIRGRK